MSKGSGNTRASTSQQREAESVNSPQVNWVRTYRSPSGGYVDTDPRRIAESTRNRNEREKFEKEQRMCRNYADFGFKIQHLYEVYGVSSADVRVLSYGHRESLVTINGEKADLKSTASANNVEHYAKHAIRDQGAEKVLFEFTSREKEQQILGKIRKLNREGFHGYYYFTGDEEPTKF